MFLSFPLLSVYHFTLALLISDSLILIPKNKNSISQSKFFKQSDQKNQQFC